MKQYIDIFKNKNYSYYFLSDLISNLGTGMSILGINWFIMDVTSSNKLIGLFMGIQITAILLLLPVAGTMADKFQKIKILQWSNLLRGLFIILVCFLYHTTSYFPFFYLLAVINGIGWAFYIPSSRGAVLEFVDKSQRLSGNALLEISLQIGFFFSAALSGFIYKYFGIYAILSFDIFTFVVAAFLLSMINIHRVYGQNTAESFYKNMADGLDFVKRGRIILLFGIIMFIPSVVTIVSNIVLPGYVSVFLGADSVIFGTADMFYGIGAFVSGLIASNITNRFDRMGAVVFFHAVSVITLFYLYHNSLVSGLLIAYFIFGLSNTSIRIIMNTVAMEIIPENMFGRVYSLWNTFSYIVQVFLLLYLGRLLDSKGAEYGYSFLAVLMGVGCILLIMIIPKTNFLVQMVPRDN